MSQHQDGYNLVFIRRGLRMAWRPLKRTFVPLQKSFLSWKRPTRGKARKRPLWRFFRPRHILGYNPPQPNPISLLTGEGTYALPYISHKLRIWFRPRHVYPIPRPPAMPPVLDPKPHIRFRRVSWIVNTARFAILQPLTPVIQKSRPTIRFKQKRPLWRFFRPRHLFSSPPPPPSNLFGAGTYAALPYVSRRLRIAFRPRHLLVLSQPVRLSFNPPPPRYRARRPLWRFFRPRHLFPQLQPAQLVLYKRPQRLRFRRLLSRFFRPKHIYRPTPAVYAFRLFRAPLRFKQKRPLWRFFRPRHILGFNPPQAIGFFPRKPGPRPRIKRARINVLRFKKNMYAFSTPPTPPPSGQADWLVRYRRRGRR